MPGVEPGEGGSAILEAAHQVIGLHALTGRWPGVQRATSVWRGGQRGERGGRDGRSSRSTCGRPIGPASRPRPPRSRPSPWPNGPRRGLAVVSAIRHWPMEKLPRSTLLVAHPGSIAGRMGFACRDASTGGASDANTPRAMGVPTADGLGPIGGSTDSPDEWLGRGQHRPRTALFAALLLRPGATRRCHVAGEPLRMTAPHGQPMPDAARATAVATTATSSPGEVRRHATRRGAGETASDSIPTWKWDGRPRPVATRTCDAAIARARRPTRRSIRSRARETPRRRSGERGSRAG